MLSENPRHRLTAREWREHCYTMSQIAGSILRISTGYLFGITNLAPISCSADEPNNDEQNAPSKEDDNDDNDDEDMPCQRVRLLHIRALHILTNAFLTQDMEVPLVTLQEFAVLFEQDLRDVLSMVCHWYGLVLDVDYFQKPFAESNLGNANSASSGGNSGSSNDGDNGNGLDINGAAAAAAGVGGVAFATSLFSNPNATLASLFDYRLDASGGGGGGGGGVNSQHGSESGSGGGETTAKFFNEGKMPRSASKDLSRLEKDYTQVCVHVLQSWTRGQALQTMTNNNYASAGMKMIETRCISYMHLKFAIQIMEAMIKDAEFDSEMMKSISKKDVVEEEVEDGSPNVRVKIGGLEYKTRLDDLLTPKQMLSRMYTFKLSDAPNLSVEVSQSVQEIHRALKLDPYNYYAQQYMGRYFYSKSRYADAQKYFKRAVDYASPNSHCVPDSLYLLGLSYLGLPFEGKNIRQVLQQHSQYMTQKPSYSERRKEGKEAKHREMVEEMQGKCRECYEKGVQIVKHIRGEGYLNFNAEYDTRTMIEYFVRHERICPNCNSNENLKVCSGCHMAYFCSKECQGAFWPKHKDVCKLMSETVQKQLKQQQQQQQQQQQLVGRKPYSGMEKHPEPQRK